MLVETPCARQLSSTETAGPPAQPAVGGSGLGRWVTGLHQALKQMAAGFEGKSEIRRSKSEANSKSEARRHAALAKRAWIDELQNSDFGFRSSFGFRASGFGLARPAESIRA